MKKQKHATSSPAELGKLLKILGTKKQREREPLAWYRNSAGLAVRLYAGNGCHIVAGEPDTVQAAKMLGLPTSRASFTGRVDAITGAGADVVHAYQAADALEGTDARTEQPHGEPVESWRLGEQMIEALGWCVKAAATDEARLVLQAVAVQSVAGGVRIVAGDNYRIHVASSSSVEEPEKAEPVRQLMMPRRLAAYLASRGEPVVVNYHKHTATLEAPGLWATWSDIGQAWPDFRSVVPSREDATGSAGTHAGRMIEAVEAVEAAAAVELALAGKNREPVQLVAMATGARSVELGAGAARASVVATGTGAGAATMNAEYLREALEGFTGSDAVGIHTKSEHAPVVFRGVAGRVAVVMPVRVPDESETMRELIEKAAGSVPTAKLRVMSCGKCGEPVEGMTEPLPGEPYQVRGTCAKCGSVPAVSVHRDAVATTA